MEWLEAGGSPELCCNCKFGKKIKESEDLECRRYPPKIDKNLYHSPFKPFPIVEAYSMCGEYK